MVKMIGPNPGDIGTEESRTEKPRHLNEKRSQVRVKSLKTTAEVFHNRSGRNPVKKHLSISIVDINTPGYGENISIMYYS